MHVRRGKPGDTSMAPDQTIKLSESRDCSEIFYYQPLGRTMNFGFYMILIKIYEFEALILNVIYIEGIQKLELKFDRH